MKAKEVNKLQLKPVAGTSHIGGINDELGGVDPEIDNDLLRLSGGP